MVSPDWPCETTLSGDAGLATRGFFAATLVVSIGLLQMALALVTQSIRGMESAVLVLYCTTKLSYRYVLCAV